MKRAQSAPPDPDADACPDGALSRRSRWGHGWGKTQTAPDAAFTTKSEKSPQYPQRQSMEITTKLDEAGRHITSTSHTPAKRCSQLPPLLAAAPPLLLLLLLAVPPWPPVVALLAVFHLATSSVLTLDPLRDNCGGRSTLPGARFRDAELAFGAAAIPALGIFDEEEEEEE